MKTRVRTVYRGFRCPVDLDKWLEETFETRTKGIVAALVYARKNGLILVARPATLRRVRKAAGMTP